MFVKNILAGSLVLASVTAMADEVLISHPLAKVTRSEFSQVIDYLVPEQRQHAMRSKEENLRGFLADYFTYKMMAEAARQQKLDGQSKIAVQVESYRDQRLTEALIEDYIAKAKRPDFSVLALEKYKSEPELFVRPEQVSAEHILIKPGEGRDDAQAKALAEDVYQLVKKDKSRFSELAKEYSDDPSVEKNSGKLGFFDRTRMVPEFTEAAFAMKKGDVSKPVKSAFGYHVIHVLDRRAETKVPFDSVKTRLMAEAEVEFEKIKRDEIISQYRGSDEIQLNDAVLADFVQSMQEQARQ